MTFSDMNQQSLFQNPLQALFAQQAHSQQQQQPGQQSGLGQAAYGQYSGPGANTGAWGGQGSWNQQRQLTQQDVSEVVRQLAPMLPHILAQAQQPQTQAAFGIGQNQRTLSPQDVNEVVRQILPIVPQIVGALTNQGYGQSQGYGGMGGQQSFGMGLPPQFQAAYGQQQNWSQQQRQLGQQDIQEVVRHLIGAIPQVIGNLQAGNQQRQY
jgi:hypothetical protein